MDIPWYSNEFSSCNSTVYSNPFKMPKDSSFLEENRKDSNGLKKGIHPSKRKFWTMNSMRNIIVATNNIFKLPERNVDKVTEAEDENVDAVYHTGLINKAFLPMRLALIAIGRWPFPMEYVQVAKRKRSNKGFHDSLAPLPPPPNYEYSQRQHYGTRRVRNYQSTLKSVLWGYSALTTSSILYVLILSTLGFFDFFLDWDIFPCCESAMNRRNIFRENLVVFLLVWGCLVHSSLSSFSYLINRKKIVRILNYWNVAADELLIEEVKSHRRFLITANVGYLVFLVLIYTAFSSWKVSLVREGAELFGSLAILPLLKLVSVGEIIEKWQLRLFGIFTIIYVIYASRCFLFHFSFHCRILQSLFRAWNSRLIIFLKKPEFNSNENGRGDSLDKIECQRLLHEMTILLKMVKQMDKMFATVLQAYYAVQLLNMCFELYMLAKSGSEDFATNINEEGRGLNIVTAVLTLIQNIYFFFTVSLDGAYVGEEAAKGMEALRRHPVNPSSSIHKKYLIYNLGFIYNQRITLTGGKYFNIDRPFILTVLGAVLTYFVIILQVGPTFQKKGMFNDGGNYTNFSTTIVN